MVNLEHKKDKKEGKTKCSGIPKSSCYIQ